MVALFFTFIIVIPTLKIYYPARRKYYRMLLWLAPKIKYRAAIIQIKCTKWEIRASRLQPAEQAAGTTSDLADINVPYSQPTKKTLENQSRVKIIRLPKDTLDLALNARNN
jgi:hypothetical protein